MAGIGAFIVHWFLRVSEEYYTYKIAFLATQSLDIGNLNKRSMNRGKKRKIAESLPL
jgi:hypothetical protein